MMADTQRQNPLLLPVVIRVVLDHVPKSSWRALRLVCKSWNEELLPRWRKQMKVRLGGLGQNELSIDGDEIYSKDNDVPSFVQTSQSNDIHQLAKYPMRFMKTISGQVTIEQTRIQRSFWKLSGPLLHELHFHGVMFKDLSFLKDIIFKLTPNLQKLEITGCDVSKEMHSKIERNNKGALTRYKPSKNVQPNLKMLKISLLTTTEDTLYRSKFPFNFMSLFSVFTNIEEFILKEFSIDALDRVFGDYEEKLAFAFDVIRTIRRAHDGNSTLNIRKLHLQDLGICFNTSLVKHLCDLSLPLEELGVLVENKDRCLERLLSKYSSLTKLAVRIESSDVLNQTHFQLRVLPQTLTELTLIGCVFEDWSFLAFTPNLTKLDVKLGYDESQISFPEVFPMDRTPLLEFVTIFIYKTRDIVPVEEVEMLTRIMPNVTKLTLSVDCDGFRAVCNAWTTLTSWEITYAKVREETFIANSRKLTSLTHLGVNVAEKLDDGREIMPEFGFITILDGFLMIPKLKKLSITFSNQAFQIRPVFVRLYEEVEDTDDVYVVFARELIGEQACFCFCDSNEKGRVKEKFRLKDVVDDNVAGIVMCKGHYYHNKKLSPPQLRQRDLESDPFEYMLFA